MTVLRVDTIAASGQTSENTGSVFFDGTGDYLSITDSTDFDFGSGDFTIEFFLYSASFSDYTGILGKRNAETDYAPLLIGTDNSAQKKIRFFTSTTGSSWISIISSSAFPLSQWVHVAVVRSGSTITLYENGVSKGSASISGSVISNSVPVVVGATSSTISASVRLNGFLSNLRIIKGKALYTSNFAVPTRELEVTPETVLVACYDGENIFAEKTGKIISAYGDRLSSPTPTATDSPIGITTFQPGLTRSVDVTAGPTLDGDLEFNSQNFFVLPKGTTTEQFPNFAGAPASSARGLFGGGYNPELNTIDYVTIATLGNASDFGDLITATAQLASCSSPIRGLFAGGQTPTNVNTINYVTISATGNAQDFGDLTLVNFALSSCSSSTRGLFGGGNPGPLKIIDYVTISSTGNALRFGDLTFERRYPSACSSSTRGVFGGGHPTNTNIIDFITISSTGNAQDFGDLTDGRFGLSSCSSPIRGIFAGGSSVPGIVNTIDYITIASLGDAIDFGDLSATILYSAACSSHTRGLVAGGQDPANRTAISYITFETTGNAQSFGDLTQARRLLAGCSNGHGGLG